MGGRSVYIISILLLCIFMGACGHRSKEKDQTEEKHLTLEDRDAESTEALMDNEGEETYTLKNREAEDSVALKDTVPVGLEAWKSEEPEGSETLKNNEPEHIASPELQKAMQAGTDEENQKNINYVDIEEHSMTGHSNQEEEMKKTEHNSIIEAASLEAYGSQEELIAALRGYPAGTVLNLSGAKVSFIDRLFYMEELTEEVKARIKGKSYGNDCDIPYEELRYIRVLYYAFDGTTQIGELIVNKAIAQDILDIFRELYGISYPIERMVLVDEYNADDDLSMAANNTSAFNYRRVAGTTRLSKHSLGLAIDINPLYNPYITKIDGERKILPEQGEKYADREKDCPYYIREGDACYKAFVSRGFTWGGDWQNTKDYQHFEKSVDIDL